MKPDGSTEIDALIPLITELASLMDRLQHLNRDQALQPVLAQTAAIVGLLQRQAAEIPRPEGADAEERVDPQVFERLMAIAGPTTAIELLDQLMIDLRAARAAVQSALQARDWAALRAQCHVLIALAGAVGAKPVQRNAEQLHAAAQHMHHEQAQGLAATLEARVHGLIGFVEKQRKLREAG